MNFGTGCDETVSIIEALLTDTGSACISLGLPSLLAGVCLFVAAVVVLRTVALAIIRGSLGWMRVKDTELLMESEFAPEPEALKQKPYKSPIESTGAWGGERR